MQNPFYEDNPLTANQELKAKEINNSFKDKLGGLYFLISSKLISLGKAKNQTSLNRNVKQVEIEENMESKNNNEQVSQEKEVTSNEITDKVNDPPADVVV